LTHGQSLQGTLSSYLTVDSLQIQYAGHLAVNNLSFSAEKGEFLTLLGPSGCGKTTTLRAIAGFVAPASGKILVDGKDIIALPPHKRNIGMVFQSYALFPHLTVHDNVGFGLRMRQVGKTERRPRVDRALEMVGLAAHGDRYPSQLSGGQQQRVALARALVIEPAILLLDEPLSNLDANLRSELRNEIRQLQKQFNILTILVTHDQQEALAVSDRIAVMSEGRIVDLGTPEALCDRPGNPLAAAFLGGRTVIAGHTRDGIFEAPGLECKGAPESATSIVLRGPRLRLGSGDGQLSLAGLIVTRVYLGDYFEADVETLSGRVRIIVPSNAPPPAVGERCSISALPGGVSFIS
jgi:putative spermidine/putrescine transport system ATP-binding protein